MVDKLHEILKGGEVSKEKGVKQKVEQFVDKALNQEHQKPEASKPEPVKSVASPVAPKAEPKKETVRLGVDNHLVESLYFPADGEDYLIESVARGGSEVPKDKEAELIRAAKVRGYQLAEVE